MRSLLLWLFLLILGGSSFAQGLHHSIRNYSPADGLPQSQVWAIIEDNNGYLWIGTQGGGLARYDGREFKVYTTLDGLLTNVIAGLRIDNSQNLWILHPSGVTRFDGVSFKKFQSTASPTAFQHFRRIIEVNDSIFIVTATGSIAKIYQDSVYYWDKQIVKDRIVRVVHKAPGGQLCYYLDDGRFLIREGANQYFIQTDFKKLRVFNIFNYHKDVWIHTNTGNFRLDLEKKKIEQIPFPLDHHIVLLYDEREDVFWTRNNNALFKESFKNGRVNRDTVLQDCEASQILVDSEGITWIATNGSGLFKYFIQDFDKCGSDHLRSVMAVLVDSEGDKWIGSMANGLWRIENGKITSYADDKEPYRNIIHCIKEGPDKNIWVGTFYGLGRFDKQTNKFKWFTYQDGLLGNSIISLEFDEWGGLWIGTPNGINYYNGTKFTSYGIKQGLNNNFIRSFHYSSSRNTLYIGTELGINTLKDEHVETLSIPGLENTGVLSIQPYRDSLLILGTGGVGVIILHPETLKKKLITTRDGLPSDFIYFGAVDEKNNLWIGSEKGITQIQLDKQWEIVKNLHYDNSNGLTGVETNQNAFYIDDNHKYFGLIDGLYEFNNVATGGRKSFDLHLTDIEIFYGEYPSRDYADSLMGFFRIPYKPVLPPDKNHITFHFNRVDKRYPKSIKFKYYLENFDKTWSQPSSIAQVTYGNLPPGSYVFKVMATNNEGSWSERMIDYPFTIQTPFYQRASFIIGMIILLAGSITLIMYIRVRQRVRIMIDTERIRMREQESLRKEIARDFHDEMGNQLTRIINYISLMKLNGRNGGTHSHQDLYTKVEESAKYLYTGTRDFIWSIDPVNDELTKLFLHIRDFGEKLFEEKSIHFRAFDEIKERVKLPYGFSREANLIFKEAMTNAFKHSQANNVTLILKRLTYQDEFEIVFEDDGIGFSPENQDKANGLRNILDRAERIGALLRIHSAQHKGTRIVLNFKLTKTAKYGVTF